MRLLVVDDDPQLRALTRAAIEAVGHEVDEATNADDGLAMLRGDPELEVVVLDLGLPPYADSTAEGLRFLREALAWNGHLKIVVVSAQAEASAWLDCVAAGAFDILTKPVARPLLEASLGRAIRFRQAETQLRLERQHFPLAIVADASTEQGVKLARESLIQRLVTSVLQESGQNVSETARRLNISREQVYYYIDKFGIQRQSS